MNHRRQFLLWLGAAGLAACDKPSAPSSSKPVFYGVDITGADYGRKLDLPDIDGKPRSLADFRGKVCAIFFGFTHCPDVCPTAMTELAQIKHDLGAEGKRIQGVFITVDPERDTPQVLKEYMASFDPSFVALRGTQEQTSAAAKEFKAFYAKAEGKEAGSYTMEHTAGYYLIDPQGRLRLFVRYGTPTQELLSDLKQLLSAT